MNRSHSAQHSAGAEVFKPVLGRLDSSQRDLILAVVDGNHRILRARAAKIPLRFDVATRSVCVVYGKQIARTAGGEVVPKESVVAAPVSLKIPAVFVSEVPITP